MTESKAVYDPETDRLGSVQESESESRRSRSGWSVAGGVREGLEEQSLQALESNVVRKLLSTTGQARRDSEG